MAAGVLASAVENSDDIFTKGDDKPPLDVEAFLDLAPNVETEERKKKRTGEKKKALYQAFNGVIHI